MQKSAKSKSRKQQDQGKLGLDLEIPINYENSLGGHPKNLTGFEPGRL